jgi:RNA polymerase sigma-70 factor (ECF subfamily)
MADYPSLPDHELVVLLKQGDEGAFTHIYNTYWKLLYRTALHILQDHEVVQDIVQNIFISVWQRREEAAILNVKAYLQQATRFSVFKAIRAQKHDQSFFDRLAHITIDIITDDPLLFKEQQQLLQELLDTLPEDCKETFRLSREENLTYKQIAALLGISEKTVEKRMTKSLKHLRKVVSVHLCLSIITVLH